jgi:hypothetical protein
VEGGGRRGPLNVATWSEKRHTLTIWTVH